MCLGFEPGAAGEEGCKKHTNASVLLLLIEMISAHRKEGNEILSTLTSKVHNQATKDVKRSI